MKIRIIGTKEEIQKTRDFLSQHYTFFCDEEPRPRSKNPGVLKYSKEFILDLFDVMTIDEYRKMMGGKTNQ